MAPITTATTSTNTYTGVDRFSNGVDIDDETDYNRDQSNDRQWHQAAYILSIKRNMLCLR